MTLKKQLEKYKKEIYHLDKDCCDKEDIMRAIGFQDAIELLMPLVGALNYIAKSAPGPEQLFELENKRAAEQALQELREKLK